MSSSRVNESRRPVNAHRVQVQDTRNINYCNNLLIPNANDPSTLISFETIPHVNRRNCRSNIPAQNQQRARLQPQQRLTAKFSLGQHVNTWGRKNGPSAQMASQGVTRLSSSISSYKTDVSKIFCSWRVSFTPKKQNNSVEEFIQRNGECRCISRIDDDDLLNSMSELLLGTARM